MAKQSKSYLSIFGLIMAFLLPIALAKVMLEKKWYQGGVTNKGSLVAQSITIPQLQQDARWQLIYLLPNECQQACLGALFTLQQVPQAIGPERDRVISKVYVSRETSLADINQKIKLSELFQTQSLQNYQFSVLPSFPKLEQALSQLQFAGIGLYLIDPLGNIMMAYPLASEKTAILAQGKDVLRDLKRLLKVSKIG
ncbi:TPA: cytochrome oxidase [Photobacterium damselae]